MTRPSQQPISDMLVEAAFVFQSPQFGSIRSILSVPPRRHSASEPAGSKPGFGRSVVPFGFSERNSEVVSHLNTGVDAGGTLLRRLAHGKEDAAGV